MRSEGRVRALGIGGLFLIATVPAQAGARQAAEVTPLPSVALPPELDRVLRDYERAWQAKDPAALAALFAEDGFVLASGRPPVRGRAAIQAAYREGGGPLALRALAYATQESVGYVIGAYGPGAGSPDTGKFVLALTRRSDGRWLIAADIDNSSRRPRTAADRSTPPVPVPGFLGSPSYVDGDSAPFVERGSRSKVAGSAAAFLLPRTQAEMVEDAHTRLITSSAAAR